MGEKMKHNLNIDYTRYPQGFHRSTKYLWIAYKDLKKGHLYVDDEDGDIFIYLKETLLTDEWDEEAAMINIEKDKEKYGIYLFYNVLKSEIIWAYPHQTLGKERIEIVKCYDL